MIKLIMNPQDKGYIDSFLEEFVNLNQEELDYLILELTKIKNKDEYYFSDQIVIDNILKEYFQDYKGETKEPKYSTYGLRWDFEEFKKFYISRYALRYDNDPLDIEKIRRFNWRIPFQKLLNQRHQDFLLSRK